MRRVMRVAGARHDGEIRPLLARQFHHSLAGVWRVERHHQRAGVGDVALAQEFELGGVAPINIGARGAVAPHKRGVAIDRDEGLLVPVEQVGDELADAAMADDDHASGLVAGRRDFSEIGVVARHPPGRSRAKRRERGNGHHRQRYRHHQHGAKFAIDDARGDAAANHHEGEFAARPQQQRRLARHAGALPGDERQRKNNDNLERDQSHRQPDGARRRGDDRADVEARADGDEEQAQQQALERLDRHLDLAAEFGFRQQQTGDEGAQRHRQARKGGDDRRAHDDEQARRHEELGRMGVRDLMEQRPQQQAAGANDRRDGGRGRQDREQQPMPDAAAAGGRLRAQHGDHEQHGRDHQVLRQQNREGGASRRRAKPPPLDERGYDHRRRGQRQGAADDEPR